ncbi:hypothetical protein SAMN05444413_108142 [Roseivivax marinus]|nr:hypothetical protein SAMN05444413_108142 [Roseivivax marinus]
MALRLRDHGIPAPTTFHHDIPAPLAPRELQGKGRKRPTESIGSSSTNASVDPVGPLQFADIGGHHLDVSLGQSLDLRHITEIPVMCTDAVLSCQNKSHVRMVARFVDLVHERRRNTVLTGSIFTVTLRTLCLEYALSKRRLLRELGRQLDLNDRAAFSDLTCVGWRHGVANRCIFRSNELPNGKTPADNKNGTNQRSQFVHACIFRLARWVR